MWIKVKEKKPPAHKLVLLCTKEGMIKLGLLFYEARTPFWSVDGWKHNEEVRLGFLTRWHELPQPPEEEWHERETKKESNRSA